MYNQQLTETLLAKIELQKKHYKDSTQSICKKCFNYEADCFEAFKTCEADQKTGFSCVPKCSHFNRKFETEYKESKLTVQNSADSRQEMMGGGFHLVEKYREEKK